MPTVIETFEGCNCSHCLRRAAIVKAGNLARTNMSPRSQKARGVQYLAGSLGQVPEYQLVQDESELRRAYGMICADITPGFARPCPTRPRHGFVDSRVVHSMPELQAVWDEARRADADAELLLMPPIKARASAVLTPSAVSVGAGNDGVTGQGRDVVTLPLAHVDFAWLKRESAGIENTPYIESVLGEGNNPYLVQLRDGPSVASVNGEAYIPKDVTVSEVWLAEGDLLAWETRVQGAGDGVVIHMPGGSMLSHYAVHAVLRGLAVVFRPDAPRVGDTLAANVNETRTDYHAMARGISYAMMESFKLGDDAWRRLRVAAVAAHQATGLMRGADGCLLIGLGIGYMLRCSIAAVLGEARHGTRHGNKPKAVPDMAHHSDRDIVYKAALQDYRPARRHLTKVWNLFHNGSWHSGFGGRRWSNVTAAIIALDSAALRFVHGPTQETFTTALAAYHTLLNAVHNGGSWIGKFSSTAMLDKAAQGDVLLVLEVAYYAHRLVLAARGMEVTPWSTKSLARPKLGKPSTLQVFRSNEYLYLQYGIPHNYISAHFALTPEDYRVLKGIGAVTPLRSFEGDGQTFHALPPYIIDRMSDKFRARLALIVTGQKPNEESEENNE